MSTDRDRSLETLLRQQHQDAAELTSAAQCVDAEVLAAWVDGALSGQALAEAEKHAAGCARCQALLASMAKTTPAAEPRPWWRAVSAKWLVPVAAVATALLVWVSVGPRGEPPTPRQPAAAATTASVEPPEPITSPRRAPTAEAGQSSADRAKERAAGLKKESVLDQADRRAGGTGGDNAIAAPQRADALDKTSDAISARPRAGGGGGGGIAAVPYPVVPPAASAPPPVAPASPPRQEAPRAAAGPPPPQSPAAADASVAESVKIAPEAEAKQLASGVGGGTVAFKSTPEIRSPQPDYRWRIVPPSGIQRSVDGGATWSLVNPVPVQGAVGGVPAAMVLTTGSSPSRDVCWIVGRAGAVLVTTDGATWRRRPVPGSPDLIGVRAADERAATVTTADGRQYATLDGGATWTLVK